MNAIRLMLAAALAAFSISVAAQAPSTLWAVSSYGPGDTEAIIGCGSCASDQRAMAIDASGHVIVTGYATTATASDMLTTKFDGATGAVLWQKTYDAGLGAHEQSWALALDGAGNAIVTGYSYTGSEYDVTTIKYAAADGAVLWQKTFTGPASGIDFGIAIGVDGAGNVFVGGNVWNGANDDLMIIKYAALDGALLWDKTFTGAAGFNDYAFALAVDAAGNVVVTGENQQSATDSDWKTINYAAADGAVLWERNYAGAGAGLDIPFSISIDAGGNALIAGNSHNGANFDGKVIKYAAADGATLWEKTFAGADGGDDMFYSLALDAGGNAIVAGFTFTTAGSNDWNVARYAASDGALLWQKTVGGTGNLSDVSVTVAIDALGNAIAGGRINNSADAANRDMHAAKFAASDGTVLWSYTYAGSAGAFDRVASVATAPGVVVLAGESAETGFPAGWRIVKFDDTAAAVSARPDFDADGRSDLVWANADGRAAVWLMNGLAPSATSEILPAGTGFAVAHMADFDGDGKADLLWQHADGRAAVWLMNGTAPTATLQILNAGSGWTAVATPDLDGDGRADIVWQHTDGTIAAWLMNGTAMTSGSSIMGAGTGWSVTKTGDFDGDGKGDLVWTHTDGRVAIWLMNGLVPTATNQILNAGSGWSVAHTADVDGDGKADIVWQHTDGSVAVWLMNGAVMASGSGILGAGSGWSVVHTADFDGNGKRDLYWQHPDGRAAIWLMNGLVPSATAQILNAGGGWTAKRTGDLDGNGKADIVWQNTDGSVAVWLMNGTVMSSGSGIIGPASGWSVSGVSP